MVKNLLNKNNIPQSETADLVKVNNEETNEQKNPVITFEKKVDKTEVEKGQTLTYTIEITNTGDVKGKATIKDEAPEGTTFVENSIKINGEATEKTAENGMIMICRA